MNVRRRLALLIDPSLEPHTPIINNLGLDARWITADLAHNTERIARALEKIESKTARRRPRNVWCQHPELHPEVES